MKQIIGVICIIFIAVGIFAIPLGIGVTLWNFAFTDAGIAFALWAGFKTWFISIICLVIGYFGVLISNSK